MSFDDIRAHGAPGAAPPRAGQLPRRVGRRHDRLDHRRVAQRSVPKWRASTRSASRGHEDRGHDISVVCRVSWAMAMANDGARHGAMAGARFVDPKILRADRQPRTAGAERRRGVHQRPAPRAVSSARRSISPSTAATSPATTSGASTGGCTRAPIATTSSSTRPTRTPTSSMLFDISKSMRFASRGVSKLEYGCFVAACLAYLAHRQRDRVGIITFDSDIVTHVPPSAKHFDMVLHTLDRAKAERPGHLPRRSHKMAEHFKRRGMLRADLGFLRGAGRDPRSDQAAALPRQRPDRLPRARSGRRSISATTMRRASRTWRAASRCRSCPQSLRERVPRR